MLEGCRITAVLVNEAWILVASKNCKQFFRVFWQLQAKTKQRLFLDRGMKSRSLSGNILEVWIWSTKKLKPTCLYTKCVFFLGCNCIFSNHFFKIFFSSLFYSKYHIFCRYFKCSIHKDVRKNSPDKKWNKNDTVKKKKKDF